MMNEHAEPTEMAGVAKAETELAYAWGALDYDDPDEFPTERLTPRRITSLGLAASLVTIAAAGAVALGVLRQPDPAPASASVPSPTVTVTAASPPAPVPSPAPSRARFLGEWGMHGMSVTLAPDGSAQYKAWLGTPIGVTWSATWSPMTESTAMVVLATQTESHGGAAQKSLYTPEGLTWIDGHDGQALIFLLRTDGYATITSPSGKAVVLCPETTDYHGTGDYFHDTKGLCGA